MRNISIQYRKIHWLEENVYEGTVVIVRDSIVNFKMNEYRKHDSIESIIDFSPPLPDEGLQKVIKQFILEREAHYKGH